MKIRVFSPTDDHNYIYVISNEYRPLWSLLQVLNLLVTDGETILSMMNEIDICYFGQFFNDSLVREVLKRRVSFYIGRLFYRNRKQVSFIEYLQHDVRLV